MAVFAVVPVKNLAVSKRRLSAVLNPKERGQLTLAMLEDVLGALRGSVVDEIVVVAEDFEISKVAEKFGAFYLSATGVGLNYVIEEALLWCIRRHASSVLVLPADVPLITVKDINRIVELGAGGRVVVLSPSGSWGTNVLFQCPPVLIPACFGGRSFVKHVKAAFQRGVSLRLFFSEGATFDVDSVCDLRRLFETHGSVSREVLGRIVAGSEVARVFLFG